MIRKRTALRLVVVLTATLACAVVSPSRAELDGLGNEIKVRQADPTPDAVTLDPATPPQVPAPPVYSKRDRILLGVPDGIDDPALRPVLEKANAKKPLTREEFDLYLRTVEKMNPGASWQTILSKLHHETYPQTSREKFVGLRYFRDGGENTGYDEVKLPGHKVPSYVLDADGRVVKVDHAYAGIRAFFNRGYTFGTLSSLCNTHFGDMGQVAFDAIKGSAKTVGGLFAKIIPFGTVSERGDKLLAEGVSEVKNSPGYMSKDQIRGNNLGFEVQADLEAMKAAHHLTNAPTKWDGWDKGVKLSDLFRNTLAD